LTLRVIFIFSRVRIYQWTAISFDICRSRRSTTIGDVNTVNKNNRRCNDNEMNNDVYPSRSIEQLLKKQNEKKNHPLLLERLIDRLRSSGALKPFLTDGYLGVFLARARPVFSTVSNVASENQYVGTVLYARTSFRLLSRRILLFIDYCIQTWRSTGILIQIVFDFHDINNVAIFHRLRLALTIGAEGRSVLPTQLLQTCNIVSFTCHNLATLYLRV